jgi:hypothetical protein
MTSSPSRSRTGRHGGSRDDPYHAKPQGSRANHVTKLKRQCPDRVFVMGSHWVRPTGVLLSASLCLAVASAAIAAGFGKPGPSGPLASASRLAPYHQCAKTGGASLLTVSAVHDVTVRAACSVWEGLLKSGRPTRCVGKPFTASAYPVLVRKAYRAWTISLVKYEGGKSIRLSHGHRSFIAGGEDAPPYPC